MNNIKNINTEMHFNEINNNIIHDNDSIDNAIIDNANNSNNTNNNTNNDNDISNVQFTLEDILVNLILISKIEIGNKLYQNGKYINIDTSYFQFISRWISGNTRSNNIIFINIVLNKAFEFTEKLIKDNTLENLHSLSRLNNDLKNSINGLTNLKQTYSYDKLIQSEIDVIIENIRTKSEINFNSMNNIPYINKNSMQNITNTNTNDISNITDAFITTDTSNTNTNTNITSNIDISDKNLAYLQNNEHISKYIKTDNTENSKKKLKNKDNIY